MPELVQTTLALIKPGGVSRGLIGRVIARYEDKSLEVVALKKIELSPEKAAKFYEEHRGEKFFGDIIEVMTSGPIIAIVLRGAAAVEVVRRLNGETNPIKAYPGTIRGDFGTTVADNIVHGSDSPQSAKREIGILFKPSELVT